MNITIYPATIRKEMKDKDTGRAAGRKISILSICVVAGTPSPRYTGKTAYVKTSPL